MKTVLSIGAALMVLMALATPPACQQTGDRLNTADYMELCQDFDLLAPVDVAILPVEAVETVDGPARKEFRLICYQSLIRKGYAPVALDYVDDLLNDQGRTNTHLSTRSTWNTAPFKGLFFSDGVLMISIECFREPAMPEGPGFEIWGKVALCDASTMTILYQHYTRRKVFPSDVQGRERFVSKAIASFTDELLSALPNKPRRARVE